MLDEKDLKSDVGSMFHSNAAGREAGRKQRSLHSTRMGERRCELLLQLLHECKDSVMLLPFPHKPERDMQHAERGDVCGHERCRQVVALLLLLLLQTVFLSLKLATL